jgi:CRISPR-associated protein Csb2
MLSLHIELLTGRYVATSYDDRGRAEWPPHPARVFSMLVDTWAQEGAPEGALGGLPEATPVGDPAERAALEWLEAQGAPALAVGDADRRDVVTVFVPVNDTAVVEAFDDAALAVDEAQARAAAAEQRAVTGGKAEGKEAAKLRKEADTKRAALEARMRAAVQAGPKDASKDALAAARGLLPEGRKRQARTFPSVTPREPRFTLTWTAAEPDEQQLAALDRLAARAHRLGHSATLISARFDRSAADLTLVPQPRGDHMLRVPRPGQTGMLEQEHAWHQQVQPRVLPCAFQAYGPPEVNVEPTPEPAVFDDDWIVLRRVSGLSLPLTRVVDVAMAVRGGLLKHARDPRAPMLAGHAPDGAPLDGAHLAIVPLPFVGAEHADGTLKGVALLLPRDTPTAERHALWAALARWEEAASDDPEEREIAAFVRGGLELRFERLTEPDRRTTLQPATWCRASRRWATVTPVALDRNPGNLYGEAWKRAYDNAAACVSDAVVRLGLPAPTAVELSLPHPVSGSRPVRDFGPYPAKEGRTRRVLVHAVLDFERPVRGPILLGAGRFFGLGLLRPVGEGA